MFIEFIETFFNYFRSFIKTIFGEDDPSKATRKLLFQTKERLNLTMDHGVGIMEMVLELVVMLIYWT